MDGLKITLYSTDCPRCNILKDKLKDAGYRFQVVTDPELMIALGFKESPILSVEGELMNFGKAIAWLKEQE